MAKLLFIAPKIAKKHKIKLHWKIICSVLSAIIVLENLYIAYLMYGR